ncbi:unnamed protein product, partial [Hapterophycus canaliculatus]
MPFFLQPEAGSGVSELLDDRLRKLKLELKASEKACQAVLPSVEAFTKGTREMCRGAGSAASAFGAAIQADSTRMEGAESPPQTGSRSFPGHDYFHGGARGSDGHGSKRGDGYSTGAGGGEMLEPSGRRPSVNDESSGESMRAELMALQLVECANEMEDHLKAQVVEPIERVLAPRSNINAAIRERSRVADLLAAAHSDYARSVARYQSSSADNVNGGPPLEVLRSGDRVVGASDAFAEANGRAEEALMGLLEERGQCLRKAASSLKAAQAGFFVRASRCVSSSVGRESTDSVSSRKAGDQKQSTRSPARDDKNTNTLPPSGEAKTEVAALALEIERGTGGGEVDVSSELASAAFSAVVEDRNKVKGKWRKGGDREAIRSDTSKRRRSSGWFKRLTSSFQTTRPRSASEELRDRMPSPLHEVADIDGGGDDEKKFWFRSTAPATMSSLQSSTDRFLFREDVSDVGASLRNGRDAGPKPGGSAKSPPVVAQECVGGSTEQAVGHDSSVTAQTGGDGSVEMQAAAEEEESDYETGSNTTEGFGSDDAGDLWEGRRSTLMGPLGRSSPTPTKSVAAEEKHTKVDCESISVLSASGTNLAQEEADEGGTVGAQEGQEEMAAPQISLGEEEMTGVTAAVSALDLGEPIVAFPAVGAESAPDGTDGGDGIDKQCNGDGGDAPDVADVDDHSRVNASDAEGSQVDTFRGPAPAPRSPYFATVSPSLAPPSLLPAPPEREKGVEAQEDEGNLPPVVVEQHVPSPFDSSPAISDDSGSKESPRAWRLSWWARASDRHPPPPPDGGEDNEEAG